MQVEQLVNRCGWKIELIQQYDKEPSVIITRSHDAPVGEMHLDKSDMMLVTQLFEQALNEVQK